MKKTIFSFGLMLTACCIVQAQPDALFQHLPPDANTVIRFNLPVMAAKIDLPALMSRLPIKTDIGRVLKDPISAGIDLHQDLYITRSGTALDSPAYTCIILHLTDSGQWSSFVKTMYPDARYFHRRGMSPAAGFYQKKPADSTGATIRGIGFAWNEHLAVFTIMHVISRLTPASPKSDLPPKPDLPPKSDLPAKPAHLPAWYIAKAVSRSQAVLQGYPGSSFTNSRTLIDAFSDDADITSWNAGGNNFMMTSLMSKISGRLHGNHGFLPDIPHHHSNSITHVRFENGRLLINSTTILPPDTAAVLTRMMDRPFDEDLAAKLPPGNLLGMAVIHVDPSAILSFVTKFRPALDSILHKKDPDLYRQANAFKGNFLIAAIAPPNDTAAHRKANFYFIFTIDDQSAFLGFARKAHLIKDSAAGAMPDTGRSMLGKLKTAYMIHDSICVMSSSPGLADAWFTTAPHPVSLLSDEFRKNFFTLAIDFKAVQAFMKSGPAANNRQSAKAQQIRAILGQLDKLIVTAGLSQGNQLTSSLDVRLADPSVNSLRLLSRFLIH